MVVAATVYVTSKHDHLSFTPRSRNLSIILERREYLLCVSPPAILQYTQEMFCKTYFDAEVLISFSKDLVWQKVLVLLSHQFLSAVLDENAGEIHTNQEEIGENVKMTGKTKIFGKYFLKEENCFYLL